MEVASFRRIVRNPINRKKQCHPGIISYKRALSPENREGVPEMGQRLQSEKCGDWTTDEN